MREADELRDALRRSLALHEGVVADYADAGALLIEYGFAREATRMAAAVGDHQRHLDEVRSDLAALEAKYGQAQAR